MRQRIELESTHDEKTMKITNVQLEIDLDSAIRNGEEIQVIPISSDNNITRSFIHFENLPFYTLGNQRLAAFKKTFKIKSNKAVFSAAASPDLKNIQEDGNHLPNKTMGCPNYQDASVFKILIKMANDSLLSGGWIRFTFYEFRKLAEELGVGMRHQQIKDSLIRLAQTNYLLDTTFSDQGYGIYSNSSNGEEYYFRLLETVRFQKPRKTKGSKDGMETNLVRFSETLRRSLAENRVKPINLEYELSLRIPLARALHSRLHSQFYRLQPGGSFKILYSDLCPWVNLPRQQSFSKAKERLLPALNELKTKLLKSGQIFLTDFSLKNVVRIKTDKGFYSDFEIWFYRGNYIDLGSDKLPKEIKTIEMETDWKYSDLIQQANFEKSTKDCDPEEILQVDEFFTFWRWYKELQPTHKLKREKGITGRVDNCLRGFIKGQRNPQMPVEKGAGIFRLPDEWKIEKENSLKKEMALQKSKEKSEKTFNKINDQLIKQEEEQRKAKSLLANWCAIPIDERVQKGLQTIGNSDIGECVERKLREIIFNYEENPKEPHHVFVEEYNRLCQEELSIQQRKNSSKNFKKLISQSSDKA